MPKKYIWPMLSVIFIALSAWPLASHAQQVKIVGIGAASCTKFLDDIVKNPMFERDYLAWMQGYLSALLLRAPPGKDEDLELLPFGFPLEKQADFLRQFCEQNGRSDFNDGVNDLYRALRGKPT